MTIDQEYAEDLRLALVEAAHQQALALRIERARMYRSTGLMACLHSVDNDPQEIFRPFSMACRWGYLDELSRLAVKLNSRPPPRSPRVERPAGGSLVIQPDGYKKWIPMPEDEYQSKMDACNAQQDEDAKDLKRDMASLERTARNYIAFTQQSEIFLRGKVRLFKSTDEIKEYILLESEDRQDNLEWYLDRIDFHDLLMKSWDLNHYEGGHQQFEYEGNSDSNSHEHSYEPKVKDDSVDDEDPNE